MTDMRITRLHLIILMLLVSGFILARNVLQKIEIQQKQEEVAHLQFEERKRQLMRELDEKKKQLEEEYLGEVVFKHILLDVPEL